MKGAALYSVLGKYLTYGVDCSMFEIYKKRLDVSEVAECVEERGSNGCKQFYIRIAWDLFGNRAQASVKASPFTKPCIVYI